VRPASKVITENIQTKQVRHSDSCFFTMVAADEKGKPTAVPPLTPSNPDEQRHSKSAKERKQLRQELEAWYRAMKPPMHSGSQDGGPYANQINRPPPFSGTSS
jgi:hypothetical protein